MDWHQWEEDFGVWFSQMESEEYEAFDLIIRAKSPMNFLAVGNTHQTYQSLLINLPIIQQQASQHLIKDSKLFPKKKQRNRVINIFGRNLRLISMLIFEDLSAEINFNATLLEESDTTVIVQIGSDGKLFDAFFEND